MKQIPNRIHIYEYQFDEKEQSLFVRYSDYNDGSIKSETLDGMQLMKLLYMSGFIHSYTEMYEVKMVMKHYSSPGVLASAIKTMMTLFEFVEENLDEDVLKVVMYYKEMLSAPKLTFSDKVRLFLSKLFNVR